MPTPKTLKVTFADSETGTVLAETEMETKTFSSGNRGYYSGDSVKIDGVRHKANLQLINTNK